MSGKAIPLSGLAVGRLTVLERVPESRPPRWHCRCECGGEARVLGAHLRSGAVRSCGCLRREKAQESGRAQRGRRKHPWVGHPLYRVWAGIQRRCENPADKSWRYYGARGVRMCAQWRSDPAAFVSWALERGWTPENRLCVSRRGDAGDYAPENCELVPLAQNGAAMIARLWAPGGAWHSRRRAAVAER